MTVKADWKLSEAVSAGFYEIRLEVPYTQADLNWMDKRAEVWAR